MPEQDLSRAPSQPADSLQASDAAAAAVAKAPRVTLDDIKAQIASTFFCSAADAAACNYGGRQPTNQQREQLRVMTICIMVMMNGYTVVGKSAPASPENFNAELGRKFAYEDCIRQLWPLLGYTLRQRLYEEGDVLATAKAARALKPEGPY
jgi:hypothetical protein